MRLMHTLALVVVGAPLLSGCEHGSGRSSPPPALTKVRQRFDPRVLEIAREYRQYQRVSDKAYWAPLPCALNAPGAGPQLSTAATGSSHGRKLYYLYAKDDLAYEQLGRTNVPFAAQGNDRHQVNSPVGQVVVKESFVPIEDPSGSAHVAQSHDGRHYRPGAPAGLFIMYKIDPTTPGTDQGWVYAVTTPDQSEVLEAGQISSCMQCHQATDRDRLFGPPTSWRR